MQCNYFRMVTPRGVDTGAVPPPTSGTSRPVDQVTPDGVPVRSLPVGMAAALELSQGAKSTSRTYANRIGNRVRGVCLSFPECLCRDAQAATK